MAGPGQDGNNGDAGGAMQLLPRHRYMLQKVDAAFGIYDESTTEFMFLHHGVMAKVCVHLHVYVAHDVYDMHCFL